MEMSLLSLSCGDITLARSCCRKERTVTLHDNKESVHSRFFIAVGFCRA